MNDHAVVTQNPERLNTFSMNMTSGVQWTMTVRICTATMDYVCNRTVPRNHQLNIWSTDCTDIWGNLTFQRFVPFVTWLTLLSISLSPRSPNMFETTVPAAERFLTQQQYEQLSSLAKVFVNYLKVPLHWETQLQLIISDFIRKCRDRLIYRIIIGIKYASRSIFTVTRWESSASRAESTRLWRIQYLVSRMKCHFFLFWLILIPVNNPDPNNLQPKDKLTKAQNAQMIFWI